ncbi:MAG: HEPN domain-containing protein [Actinobacteria bacterium]|nr:HEPN domain-containing protein [Actinomycetota bacterium]
MRWADEDFALAEHTAADPDVVARGACAWAHQAAEKALKALLILRNIDPPKLHDLDRLAKRLPHDEGASFAPIELPELTRWSIEGRYPADLDEATRADGLKAIAVARQVLDVVRLQVSSEGSNQGPT